jgi:hypothetical protein
MLVKWLAIAIGAVSQLRPARVMTSSTQSEGL